MKGTATEAKNRFGYFCAKAKSASLTNSIRIGLPSRMHTMKRMVCGVTAWSPGLARRGGAIQCVCQPTALIYSFVNN